MRISYLNAHQILTHHFFSSFAFYKGHYATGKALEEAGVVSSNDMTLEAISCKIAYLMGRKDLEMDEIAKLMCVSIRGEGGYCNVW